LSRDRWFTATTVVVITIGLLAGALCLPPAEAVPSDTFTVGIHLKVYEIEMLLSTEEDTTRVVPGWVDMGNMLPGETVAVYISATGYQDMYATADPNYLRFEREGRQYFNLTVVLMERTSTSSCPRRRRPTSSPPSPWSSSTSRSRTSSPPRPPW